MDIQLVIINKRMESEHKIEMCVKETDKVEPAGLGFGLGKPDRSSVPQGLCLSNNSMGFGEPVFGNTTTSTFGGLVTQPSNPWKPFSTVMVLYQRRMQTFQRWPNKLLNNPSFSHNQDFIILVMGTQ